jgi:hypothetical protein
MLRAGHSNTWSIQKTLSVALDVPPVIHLEIKKFKVADGLFRNILCGITIQRALIFMPRQQTRYSKTFLPFLQ